MKNVLLLVHDDEGQESRLQVALDITRAIGGHLHCLDVALPPSAFLSNPYDGPDLGILLQDEVRQESANKVHLQQRLEHEDVPWSWADTTNSFENALRDAAGLSDLIVVNRHLSVLPFPAMRRLASDLIVHARRPILAVPDETKSFDAFGHVLVAWDGSTSATAAMIAAVPLLKLADKVTLIQVDDGSVDTQAEEAATYLAKYDIEARISKAEPFAFAIADELLQAIKTHSASYVVMGGYGHHRLTEKLFGGVTRTMLTKCPVPLFLAHG